ncbi:MAG: hypothetical protein SFY95_00870 [Planctomycetota bacterium]|nr:hypothetical protein [Planctomycetota bacterium]
MARRPRNTLVPMTLLASVGLHALAAAGLYWSGAVWRPARLDVGASAGADQAQGDEATTLLTLALNTPDASAHGEPEPEPAAQPPLETVEVAQSEPEPVQPEPIQPDASPPVAVAQPEPPPPPPEPEPIRVFAPPAQPEVQPVARPQPDARIATPSAPASVASPAPTRRTPARGGELQPSAPRPGVPAGQQPITFAGLSAARAARVVYVVDSSAPMVHTARWVFDEVQRSVDALSPEQSFQVILFGDPPGAGAGEGLRTFRPALTPAVDDAKFALSSWLSRNRPQGRSDPMPALRKALNSRPDLVFVLSRTIKRSGTDQSAEASLRPLLAELDRLNPRDPRTGQRPVVIKAIQFLDEDPRGLLQSIAREHGDGEGSYRVLPLERLTQRSAMR